MNLAFDSLEYAKGAEKIGIKREHAEYQARALSSLINSELVTKNDLTNEIQSLELRLIKWMIGISFSQAAIILGVLGFILKH